MKTVVAYENGFLWRRNGETLSVVPWGESSVRVRARIQREIEDTRWALLDPVSVQTTFENGENEAALTVGKLRVTLTETGWSGQAQLHFWNQKGELLFQEMDACGALARRSRDFRPSAESEHRLSVLFDANEGERLYGMGQYQQEELDCKGCSFDLCQRNTQASVPFVVSSRGYGFLWHCPSIGRATFAKNRTVWEAYAATQMDYWVTAGDHASEIMEHYGKATGTAPMMPEYGLGFWQCKLRYWNQEELLGVAREYKRRGLPLDVIVCDFFHWKHLGDYRMDEEFWPDLAGMARERKAMGVELMVSIWPQVGGAGECYEDMKREGLLMHTEGGVGWNYTWTEHSTCFDPTNPRTREYVWDVCKRNYYDKGVRLFWLDEAEPEIDGYDYEHYRYWAGPGQAVSNLYPQQYARMFYDGMRAAGMENPVNLARCAWAGSQRYGALVWSGDIHSDWATFRKQVCAGLSMGMAGIPWWTTDIGGFSGADSRDPAFRELLVRWFQWGCFCPVMRLHGDREPHTELFKGNGERAQISGGDNERSSFGEENCQ